MKKLKFLPFILLTILVGCKSGNHKDLGDGVFALVETNKGDITIKLHHEATPITVASFISLAEGTSPFVSDSFKGKKYYNGLTFHRVMKNFMIQGGDPTATGSGSPGYRFDNEIVDSLVHDSPGVVSMANAGPNTNGSQFFITHVPYPSLNGSYSVFGKVVEGIEVVDSIANVKTKIEGSLKNKPVEDIVINTVEIIKNGKDAKAFDAVTVMTNYFDKVAVREEENKKIAAQKIAIAQETAEKLAKEFETQRGKLTTLPSGLKMLYIEKGTGKKPKIGSYALVNYAGYFTNGRLFDSNIKEIEEIHNKYNPAKEPRGLYNPVPMQCSPEAQLAAGFREGLLLMKVGDKVRLFVPPHLGYGDVDYGPIPANSELVFDLEITAIQ